MFEPKNYDPSGVAIRRNGYLVPGFGKVAAKTKNPLIISSGLYQSKYINAILAHKPVNSINLIFTRVHSFSECQFETDNVEECLESV